MMGAPPTAREHTHSCLDCPDRASPPRTLHLKIAAVRERLGVTVAAAAAAAGVARRTWQRWERADRLPRAAYVRFLENVDVE